MKRKEKIKLANIYKRSFSTTRKFEEDVKNFHRLNYYLVKYIQFRKQSLKNELISILKYLNNIFGLKEIIELGIFHNVIKKDYFPLLKEIIEIYFNLEIQDDSK